MSKVRNLPEITTLADDDLFYVVDDSAGPNGGRKIKKSNLTATAEAHANSHQPGGSDALATAAPIIVNADGNNDVGVSTSFSRADHKHDVATGTPVSQTPDQINDAGVSSNLARADHVHNIPATAPTTNLSPATTNSEGAAASFARGDHTHAIDTGLVGDISTILPDDAAAAGVVDKFARADHKHAIAADVASGLDATSTNTEGVGVSFARNDHTHAIASGAPSTQTPDQANAIGTSSNFARADHVHQLVTAAPSTTLSPATSNAQGASTSFSRADHTHAIATALVGDITTIQPDDAAAAGTANTFARGDHKHAIVAAAPSNTGTANSEGVSTSFARADHVHNTVIANQEVSSDTSATTASLTDVLIVGMSVTPASGTYLVMFSSSTLNSGNGAERNYVSIYSGGTQVVGTERRVGISGGATASVSSQTVVTVNGSQAVEARWRVIAGTGTMYQRRMSLVRLG